ncbi:MAG TPA: hypothetical protein VMV42_01280 [archaeon]|nr:hypothetical protein [archaeon]
MDAGHCFTRKRAATKYDPNNLRPQCKQCNGFGKPGWARSSGAGEREEFKRRLAEEGVNVDALEIKSITGKTPTVEELQDMIEDYTDLLDQMDRRQQFESNHED